MEEFFGFLLLLVLGSFALVLYFVPTIIATKRRHKNIPAIFALNLLLGWALIGWVGALVWSLTSD